MYIMILHIIVFHFLLCCSDIFASDGFHSTLGHLKPRTDSNIQAQAAEDVIRRLIGDKADFFNVTINPAIASQGKDAFTVFKDENSSLVLITANSGVAAAWGFHHYLKYYCMCHISWEADQLSLPEILPPVNITVISLDRFRYYQNVCTSSYSFVWWNWTRWEREIDWMALNGINFALATNGQEAIWKRIYLQLNLTENDIDEHFAGPAFLAWSRMGNIRGWAGPLTDAWHNQSIILQHKILTRMRELGIIPILPAFAGHVPRAFRKLYPEANMTLLGTWNSFQDEYCCPYVLEPTESLFRQVGNMYHNELIAEFDTDHVYFSDTFNEMEPSSGDLDYISNIGSSIFQAMTDVDPEAVWVKQGWEFLHSLFWTSERVRAFLTSVPLGRMIVLDLQSEQQPLYTIYDSYYGQPFIWCMLHNFGGTLGLFGSMSVINEKVFEGRKITNSTMIGTGLTPEGINQNYVVYDLMNEMAWRQEPADLGEWMEDYSTRRYGSHVESAVNAWQYLRTSVYNFDGSQRIRGKYVLNVRPSLHLQPSMWYNVSDVIVAWDELLNASYSLQNISTYRHDLVDVTRQALELLGTSFYVLIVQAYNDRNITSFQENASRMLDILADFDRILSSSPSFLLGSWLESAKSLGTTPLEKQWYEYNARNQITLWGPRGEIRDYANKQWGGVAANYFLPRWKLFLEALNNTLTSGQPFNSTKVNDRILKEVEEPFTYDTTVFPDSPVGDSVDIALELHLKWRSAFDSAPRWVQSETTLNTSQWTPEVFYI